VIGCHIVLRCRWCNIIVLNARALREEKSDDSNYSFMRNFSRFLIIFPKYHTKILFGDFNAKVGRKNIFKLTTAYKSLHQDSNDSSVRIVIFATSKILVVKSMMFPHRNIHK